MKMDRGYESETGQVRLFNVTPFTPHLPHWQLAFVCLSVCVFVHADLWSYAFCEQFGACVCGGA